MLIICFSFILKIDLCFDTFFCVCLGFVMYNGSLLDVGKLMSQMKRSEDARIDTEKYLAKLRYENGENYFFM